MMGAETLPQELIRAKRVGQALSPEVIRERVGGISDGSLSDAQVGALASGAVAHG